jgi:Transposase DDE domain
MVQSLLTLAKLGWPVPDFGTVSRCQRHLRVQQATRPSTAPLHLLGDHGINLLGEGYWKGKKLGAEYRRQWRKFIWALT